MERRGEESKEKSLARLVRMHARAVRIVVIVVLAPRPVRVLMNEFYVAVFGLVAQKDHLFKILRCSSFHFASGLMVWFEDQRV